MKNNKTVVKVHLFSYFILTLMLQGMPCNITCKRSYKISQVQTSAVLFTGQEAWTSFKLFFERSEIIKTVISVLGRRKPISISFVFFHDIIPDNILHQNSDNTERFKRKLNIYFNMTKLTHFRYSVIKCLSEGAWTQFCGQSAITRVTARVLN